MWAGLCGCLDHPGPQPLTAHFHQTKARNTPYLNARTVCFELIFDPLFNRIIVSALFHVDKVDHDQTGKIAQS